MMVVVVVMTATMVTTTTTTVTRFALSFVSLDTSSTQNYRRNLHRKTNKNKTGAQYSMTFAVLRYYLGRRSTTIRLLPQKKTKKKKRTGIT